MGVLGTGARIPFGFLELGSRTGCSLLAGRLFGLGRVGQCIKLGKAAGKGQPYRRESTSEAGILFMDC
jgi:hypothetical protein